LASSSLITTKEAPSPTSFEIAAFLFEAST